MKIKITKTQLLLLGVAISLFVGYKYYFSSTTAKVTYQTSTVEKGLFINSVSASGTITSGDTTYITTGATGTVSKVFVKNGDSVKKDQKLAEIILDEDGQITQTIAWNNYLTAKEKVSDSYTAKNTADKDMWTARQALLDAEKELNDKNAGAWNNKTRAEYTYNEKALVDKTYEVAQNNFIAIQSKYQNATSDIYTAQAKATTAYRNYQKVSATIYSPADGVLNNFTLAPGVVLSSGTNSSSITVSSGTDTTTNSTSVTSQRIGAVKNPNGNYQATINLTEVDVVSVQSGQKVSLALDAFTDKTLTGTVLAVNTSGSVNSGVTSYTANILVDKTSLDIYTNMAVSAQIIIKTIDNALLIPNSAIKTSSGKQTVQVIEAGIPTTKEVMVGDSNDTQTVIVSGLTEGESVVTSTTPTITTKSTSSTSNSSPFTSVRVGGGPGF